ncbi:MAG: sugar transferase [bacterium]
MKKTINNINRFSTLLQIATDGVSIILSFTIQYILRFTTGLFSQTLVPSVTQYLLGLVLFLIYWLIVLFFLGMYKNWYQRSPFDELFALMRAIFIGTFILVFVLFYPSSESLRMMFVVYFLLLTSFTVIGRYSIRQIDKKFRFNGIIAIPVIIVGDYNKAKEFHLKTLKAKNWGYHSLGIVITEPTTTNLNLYDDETILGFSEDLNSILELYRPKELIISTDKHNHKRLLSITEIADSLNIKVKIEPDLYEIFTGSVKTQYLYGVPLVEISEQLMKPINVTIKRIFDIIFSSLVILLGLPFWLIIALFITIDSRGGIFFIQQRVCKGGKIFNMYKFRSMKVETQPKTSTWTIVNDPRVTRFGKFIRKTHLDEIPQFVNVLIGDMSVVGPRPEQETLVEQFSKEEPTYKRRLIVRPGITGWWQVKYTTYELSIDEIKNRLKDDFYYIENMSLKLDIEIIIRTVWCVITGHGQT